ncbi:MAG: wax ester/triacylglycerol synthase family O-acyltransferase [Actinomycetota bacterium]|nr:wax ester/triacylglycerol synthase family O-acyltransferase [Actinomycetota bacterium]
MSERELRFEQRMSDTEALMWSIEKDPWFNASAGSISVLDRPLDMRTFRRRIRAAVVEIPRLRERVVPGFGRLSPPAWAPDDEFDFDHHVRHVTLPEPGTLRDLYDLATRIYEDPFDRTRPLWQFVVIDGVEGGRGALLLKIHHSVTDGIGAVRLAEHYMDVQRRVRAGAEVDLEAVVAGAAHHAADAKESGGDRATSLLSTAGRSAVHLVRRQAGMARRALGEAMLWTADPMRAVEVGSDVVHTTRSTVRELTGESAHGGSPLWHERSRRRHLEAIRVPLDELKAGGHALGGSVNDAFVTATVNAAIAYHEAHGVSLERLNLSFVVSTREDSAIGGNSFTPTTFSAPATPMTLPERFTEIQRRMAERRADIRGAGALSGLAGVANLLPTSVVTRVARDRAATQDFATSNLRAAPFTMYVGGAKVLWGVPLGPVAGTAANITAISYDGGMDIGILSDPAAIERPDELRGHLEDALGEIMATSAPVIDLTEGAGSVPS